MVWGAAAVAASGAAILLATALTSVPEPASLVQATESLLPAALLAGQPTVSAVFATQGKQVPLPPGEWVVMQGVVSPTGPRTGEIAAPVASTALFHLRGHRVDAAMLVQVNPEGAASNWGLAPGCTRQDFYWARIRYTSDHDFGLFLRHLHHPLDGQRAAGGRGLAPGHAVGGR